MNADGNFCRFPIGCVRLPEFPFGCLEELSHGGVIALGLDCHGQKGEYDEDETFHGAKVRRSLTEMVDQGL